jgi:hypothetical protein
MDEAPHPSAEPMTREEIARTVFIAVRMELYKLRWASWRKHMTVEEVLKQHGVDAFCDAVTERLMRHTHPLLYRAPITLGHSGDSNGIGIKQER